MTNTNLPFAWSVAVRELRGGLAGFRVFLACLILGVAGHRGGGLANLGHPARARCEGQVDPGRRCRCDLFLPLRQ